MAPAIMIAITVSGNNNLRLPLSYSYARSWQKAGPEAVVFLKILYAGVQRSLL
jgi:hypothetical protein